MTEPAANAFYDGHADEIDAIAQRIVDEVKPAAHAGGVLLLAATRIIGHLAGHLDNVRVANGQERLGPTGSMLEAYKLVNAGSPATN